MTTSVFRNRDNHRETRDNRDGGILSSAGTPFSEKAAKMVRRSVWMGGRGVLVLNNTGVALDYQYGQSTLSSPGLFGAGWPLRVFGLWSKDANKLSSLWGLISVLLFSSAGSMATEVDVRNHVQLLIHLEYVVILRLIVVFGWNLGPIEENGKQGQDQSKQSARTVNRLCFVLFVTPDKIE